MRTLTLLLVALAAFGCGPQKDGQYAFRAPGADHVIAPAGSAVAKPAIPLPKPDHNPPQVLK